MRPALGEDHCPEVLKCNSGHLTIKRLTDCRCDPLAVGHGAWTALERGRNQSGLWSSYTQHVDRKPGVEKFHLRTRLSVRSGPMEAWTLDNPKVQAEAQ